MATTTAKPKVPTRHVCTACAKGIDSKSSRIPKGWTRVRDELLCGSCFGERFASRAVTLPIIGPLDGVEWPELRRRVKAAWTESTRLYNWVVTELYARDVRRKPGMERLPKMECRVDYLECRSFAPTLPSRTTAAICVQATATYQSQRYELLWTGARSLANFKWPQPSPVSDQAWHGYWIDEESRRVPAISVELPGEGGGNRINVQLASGKDWWRQVGMFGQLVSGEAISGELKVCEMRARESDGRNGVRTNESGRPMKRLAVKIVGYFPKRERQPGDSVFAIRTDNDSFLYGVVGKRDTPWILHADDFRDQCFQHHRNLQRMADDSKHERRKPKRRRKGTLMDYRDRCEKFHARQKSFIDETIAKVVGFAARNRVAVVRYRDQDRGFLPSFAYHVFALKLAEKCRAAGMQFEHASGDVVLKSREPLAENTNHE